jgi:predicted glycosyltransferase involved in capsule biosynthesis
MSKATVCIPWRPTDDRLSAHDRIRRFWDHFGFHVVEGDSDPNRPFHRAQARNNAIDKAYTDAIIFCDADTLPMISVVYAALDELDTAGVVYPHTSYRHIPAEYVFKEDIMLAPPVKEYRNSDGGVFLTTKKTYWDVGGMDERLHPVWGFEDSCFSLAAATLSTVKRLAGIMISFNHHVDGDRIIGESANWHRWQLYVMCQGKPDLMRELIRK